MTQSSDKFGIGWFVVVFGFLLCGIPYSRYAHRHRDLPWVGRLFGIALVGVLIGSLLLLVWFLKHQQRRFGLRCPIDSRII
jgi:hypothetical protein